MQTASASFDGFGDSEEILSMIERAIRKAKQEIGTFNILIAGRTGVGKSTLINEVFQGRVAETGQGRPVSKDTRRYTKKGVPLAVYDTRGLELKEYKQIIDELTKFVGEKAREPDVNEHIHVAWVCVSEDGRRVEDAEIELHLRLAEFMPVLGVITKARADEGFNAEVQSLLPKANNVVSVRALSERLDDVDVVLPPKGMKDLLDATVELIPDAVQRALAVSQRVSIDLKKRAAHKVVLASAAAATAAGAVPIPFADAAVLVPIQVGMLAGISATFGIELSKAFFSTLVAAMAGPAGATFLGRAVVSNVLKLVPGVGSVAGGVVAATTAATLTTALGELYIAVLAKLFTDSGGEPPSPEVIAQEFKNRLPAKRD